MGEILGIIKKSDNSSGVNISDLEQMLYWYKSFGTISTLVISSVGTYSTSYWKYMKIGDNVVQDVVAGTYTMLVGTEVLLYGTGNNTTYWDYWGAKRNLGVGKGVKFKAIPGTLTVSLSDPNGLPVFARSVSLGGYSLLPQYNIGELYT